MKLKLESDRVKLKHRCKTEYSVIIIIILYKKIAYVLRTHKTGSEAADYCEIGGLTSTEKISTGGSEPVCTDVFRNRQY